MVGRLGRHRLFAATLPLISLRAATATHANIMARRAFTVSLPRHDQIAQADFFGMVSGRDCDKFERIGLTAAEAEFVEAPCVAEFPLDA